MESSMSHQSNLDAPVARAVLPQCPREWQWACRNGECIPRYDTCDGIAQCSDGSDEWDCTPGKIKQDGGFQQAAGDVTIAHPTVTTTTTAVPETSFFSITRSEMFYSLLAFAVLALLLVLFIRRRARAKAFARNRRGNMLQQDSDEDDILISSMYS